MHLQHVGGIRNPGLEFLLLRVERLAGEVHGGLRSIDARPVLLHIELRVPHFNPHLVFELLQPNLRLAQFQFRAHLVGLRRAVQDWNGAEERKLIAIGESKPDAMIDPCELAAWTMVANLVLNLDEVLSKG